VEREWRTNLQCRCGFQTWRSEDNEFLLVCWFRY
jgi:hypothetical protein